MMEGGAGVYPASTWGGGGAGVALASTWGGGGGGATGAYDAPAETAIACGLRGQQVQMQWCKSRTWRATAYYASRACASR